MFREPVMQKFIHVLVVQEILLGRQYLQLPVDLRQTTRLPRPFLSLRVVEMQSGLHLLFGLLLGEVDYAADLLLVG
jgi:hypothetical protein